MVTWWVDGRQRAALDSTADDYDSQRWMSFSEISHFPLIRDSSCSAYRLLPVDVVVTRRLRNSNGFRTEPLPEV